VEVFCCYVGYTDPVPRRLDRPIEDGRRIVDVTMMAHVGAARLVVSGVVERGEGYLLQVLSSAALITGPSGPGYTTSKHAALGFAEW
jgi:short-subunit dehydrogenase